MRPLGVTLKHVHPIMNRMHKPDPKLPPDQQDKRSVVSIEYGDVERWLQGGLSDAIALLIPPVMEAVSAS